MALWPGSSAILPLVGEGVTQVTVVRRCTEPLGPGNGLVDLLFTSTMTVGRPILERKKRQTKCAE